MIRPFAIEPDLSSHFPSPEELEVKLAEASRATREIVARLWLTEGLPFAFMHSPAVYENLRGWLAFRLSVHPKEITLIGSARIGYSLAPRPEFGRKFSDQSDLDLSIISSELFQRVTGVFADFSSDYKSRVVIPRSSHEQAMWDENLLFGIRNIPKGFFDPNKIPTFDRYPVIQQISQSMWVVVKKLEVTRGAPIVRRASVRVYRDWQSFIDRLSLNLKTLSRSS